MSEQTSHTFSSKFESVAHLFKIDNTLSTHSIKKGLESTASIKNLGNIFDKEEILEKIESNPDLLFISSNLLVLDEINLNGDIILKKDLLEIADLFKGKFINKEHIRADGAIGVISSVGYSKKEDNQLIDKDTVMSEEKELQLVIGGYLWRLIDKEICELIENSSDNEDSFISTSFEFLFNDYEIVVSKSRNIKDSIKIIKSSDEEWQKYDKILKANGGSGRENDLYVGRILKDEILPVGAGIVRKPASGIKGIYAITPNELEKIEMLLEENEEDDEENDDDESENNIKNENLSVKANIKSKEIDNKFMEIKTLQELESKWDEVSKLEATASMQNIRKVFEAEILAQSEKFAQQIKEKEDFVKNVEASKQESDKKIEELTEVVSNLKKELDEVRATQASVEQATAFNNRMSSLDEVFELDDEDRGFLAEEVKTIESDEAFAKWMDKKKKLMKEKTKAYMAEKKANMEEKEKTSCARIDAKDVIASVKEISSQIPNSIQTEKTMAELFANAFADNVTVNGVKFKDLKK